MNETNSQDTFWMKKAIKLAHQGLGLTAPNPPVGAVIVYDCRIIGAGYHQQAGQPHAERNAIRDGIERGNEGLFKDSTIYITLEPCCTTGKTPPCTEAILEHKFKRVVYGSCDPNPKHQGRSKELLQHQGIRVTDGIMKEECDWIIRGFRKNMLFQQPWVIGKSAMSLDGKIVRASQFGQWLTNSASRSYVHTLRAECDAILTGGNTVRLDNPSLTIRNPDREIVLQKQQPWRIIVSRDLEQIPKHSVCLTDSYKDRTLLFEKVSDWGNWLQKLYQEKNISMILLECGGSLMREFLEHRLIDEWVGFYAPIITGGGKEGVMSGAFLSYEAYLEKPEYRIFDSDFCVRGAIKYRET